MLLYVISPCMHLGLCAPKVASRETRCFPVRHMAGLILCALNIHVIFAGEGGGGQLHRRGIRLSELRRFSHGKGGQDVQGREEGEKGSRNDIYHHDPHRNMYALSPRPCVDRYSAWLRLPAGTW